MPPWELTEMCPTQRMSYYVNEESTMVDVGMADIDEIVEGAIEMIHIFMLRRLHGQRKRAGS